MKRLQLIWLKLSRLWWIFSQCPWVWNRSRNFFLGDPKQRSGKAFPRWFRVGDFLISLVIQLILDLSAQDHNKFWILYICCEKKQILPTRMSTSVKGLGTSGYLSQMHTAQHLSLRSSRDQLTQCSRFEDDTYHSLPQITTTKSGPSSDFHHFLPSSGRPRKQKSTRDWPLCYWTTGEILVLSPCCE